MSVVDIVNGSFFLLYCPLQNFPSVIVNYDQFTISFHVLVIILVTCVSFLLYFL